MTLRIFTSTVADGPMKPLAHETFASVSDTIKRFHKKNQLHPHNTTLVKLLYEGTDYTRYHAVTERDKGDGIVRESTITSDALVTTNPGHALFLPLADCIGAVIYDETHHVLMLSHLGRHNLEQFGGTKSIDYLKKHYHSDPATLTVWLSPAAGSDNYPLFSFENRSLHDVAASQLTAAGVIREHITVSPIDTTKDATYFSHSQFLKGARESDGRFAVVAVMS